MDKSFSKLQSHLGIPFINIDLLKQAFTHSSYMNEHKAAFRGDNERLEFLGDAVLELTVSDFLYRKYPNLSEGELTKMRASLVCEPSLFQFAEDLQLGLYVLLSKGEELTGGRNRPSLLADIFESLVGAIYLDQGLDKVKWFLDKSIFAGIESDGKMKVKDYKTRLQEHAQNIMMIPVEYRIVEERGSAHEREFVSEVYIGSVNHGDGCGRTKKESEQQAAAKALAKLNIII